MPNRQPSPDASIHPATCCFEFSPFPYSSVLSLFSTTHQENSSRGLSRLTFKRILLSCRICFKDACSPHSSPHFIASIDGQHIMLLTLPSIVAIAVKIFTFCSQFCTQVFCTSNSIYKWSHKTSQQRGLKTTTRQSICAKPWLRTLQLRRTARN